MKTQLIFITLLALTNAFQTINLNKRIQVRKQHITPLYSSNVTKPVEDYAEWLGFPRNEWGKSVRVTVYAFAFGSILHDVMDKVSHN